MKKDTKQIPTAEEIISQIDVSNDLLQLNGFEEIWHQWVFYKQEEAMDDRSNSMKPWRTIQAGQREMSHIRNQYRLERDVVHVIAESMRNQWIGIRFDLISDRQHSANKPKTRDQISALDVEWSKLNQQNQLN